MTSQSNHTLAALVRLHAEIGGKIKENERQAAELAEQAAHIEAVIRMFDPGFNMRRIAPQRRYQSANPWFKRGTVYRLALESLRTATAPMTAAEVADALLAGKGVTDATAKQHAYLRTAIRCSLENHAGKTVERVGDGVPRRWRVI